jgi:glucose/arabinose dehydrogenase
MKWKELTGLLFLAVTAACQPLPSATVTTTTLTAAPMVASTVASQPTATPRVASSWKMEEVAQGLTVPWSIVFASAERLLVSERTGRVREIVDGRLNPQPLYIFNDVATVEETGLMGMALDPDYADNRTLYACYTSQGEGKMTDRVVRLIDNGGSLSLDGVV